jgi:hypothetical protein
LFIIFLLKQRNNGFNTISYYDMREVGIGQRMVFATDEIATNCTTKTLTIPFAPLPFGSLREIFAQPQINADRINTKDTSEYIFRRVLFSPSLLFLLLVQVRNYV